MTIHAALLDERGIFLKIDTLKSKAGLTVHHLPHITSCDLPPGKYRWMPTPDDKTNPYGGQFVPLPKNTRAER